MAIEATLMAASVVGLAGAVGAWRESRTRRNVRQNMLTPCRHLFDTVEAAIAPDGYPRLAGSIGGKAVKLSLVHDTLAMRRLPQLWLALSISARIHFPSLIVTARPRCEDFVGWRPAFVPPCDVPAWLPTDMRVRAGTEGQHVLAMLREPLSQAFTDPLLKEVAFGAGGIELLYRLSEGRRGAHLLLRQAAFDAVLTPDLVRRLLAFADQCEPLRARRAA